MEVGVIGIILLSAVGVLGDFFLDLAGREKQSSQVHFFLIGMLIYALSAFGWFYIIKQVKLEDLGILYALTTSFLLILVGVLFFKEQLQAKEIIGLILGFLSILLLSRFH